MRISIWTPNVPLPGCDSWADLKRFLPQHDWVNAREDGHAEVDLQVVLLPHGDDLDAAGRVPEGPALFVIPDAFTYRAWVGVPHRAVGFACFSNFTADLIRQTQVAPCTVLARNPLAEFAAVGDLDDDAGVSVFLPGGDLASAQVISGWLGEITDLRWATEIRILGPFTADALNELQKSTRESTARIVLHSRASDDEVADLIGGSSRTAFVDERPEAEISPYLWESARRGVPAFILGTGAYADLPTGAVTQPASAVTFGPDLDAFIQGNDEDLAQQAARAMAFAEESHGRADFVRTLSDGIDRAMAFRPFEEAVHSVRLNLAHRGLSGPEVHRAAAASLDWMLGRQPTCGSGDGGSGG